MILIESNIQYPMYAVFDLPVTPFGTQDLFCVVFKAGDVILGLFSTFSPILRSFSINTRVFNPGHRSHSLTVSRYSGSEMLQQ